MSEEEKAALLAELTESVKSLIGEALSTIPVGDLAQKIEILSGDLAALKKGKKVKDPDPVQPEQPAEVLALQERIASLEKMQQEAEASARSARLDALYSSAIAKSGTNAPGILKDVLVSRFGSSLQEEGGNFYVKNGSSVQKFEDAVSSFLRTDEGARLLPPISKTAVGIKSGSAPESSKDPTPAELFQKAFNIS